jgi:16S rRNA (guanine527-N7)-methyltransferase
MKLLVEEAALLGLSLHEGEIDKFAIFMLELSKWNHKINLTAIKGGREVITKHLLDSLTLLAHVNLGGKLLDIGSGAGFPSIPLSIIRPDLAIVSVDAVQKKILFQKHIARTLKLANFTPLHARVEELCNRSGERYDFILSRAFSSIKTFAELSLPLLADGGKIVAMKGAGGREEALKTESELAGLMMTIERVIEFRLPVTGDNRSLIVLSKGSRT